MASRMVELQETVEQSDRCRHKIVHRFFSITCFRVGVPLGCRPPECRWWECSRSRDGRKGIVLVGTSRTQVEGQGATRLAVDDRKLPSGLAFQSRGLGRRTSESLGQFEGCVTESLQTITAILFGSADNDSAVTGQHARLWWKCLCLF